MYYFKTGDYLSLFELLDLPVIGPSAKVLHLVADKVTYYSYSSIYFIFHIKRETRT